MSFRRVSGGASSSAEIYASISARFPEETCALLGEDVDARARWVCTTTGPGCARVARFLSEDD